MTQAYNASALSIFKQPLTTAPSERGWFRFERNFEHERTDISSDLHEHSSRRTPARPAGQLAEAFWDGPVFAAATSVVEALNGIDELLDVELPLSSNLIKLALAVRPDA